jgi:predicted metal-dependent hydrolase
MVEVIELGDVCISVTRKDVRNVHLSVHPPDGRVTLVAPLNTRLDVARAYAISKLMWIRQQQEQLKNQARETPRAYVDRESHYLWGRRRLLKVEFAEAKPSVKYDHRYITITVRPGSDVDKRAAVMHEWHKSLLHAAVPGLISKWQDNLGVVVRHYFLQRMKTKWGSCNYTAGNIRINTELVKKPKDLLEYVVVHELAHLHEMNHSPAFWNVVASILPDHMARRKELQKENLANWA